MVEQGDDLVVPGDVLVEAYVVMTRLPPPHRVFWDAACSLLRGSLEHQARVVTIGGEELWPLLRELGDDQVAGGRVYDARILAAARKAGAGRLITLDHADFERFDPCPVDVVVAGRRDD